MSTNNKYVVCVDKTKSVNAMILAEALDAELLVAGSLPKKKITHFPIIINYGRSEVPVWYDQVFEKQGIFINKPEAVSIAVDKKKTCGVLSDNGIHAPSFTKKTTAEAIHYLSQGNIIVIRRTLTGKGGEGIVIASTPSMYDKIMSEVGAEEYHWCLYYPKTHEFRVHVAFGQAISITQKKRMGKAKLKAIGLEKVNPYIRNHSNGWVFAFNNLHGTAKSRNYLKNKAVQAVKACGLDFGAVDVMAEYKDGDLTSAMVCEVNTAPGLQATATKEAYVNTLNNNIETLSTFAKDGMFDVPGSELFL